jgi:hypothetical protein
MDCEPGVKRKMADCRLRLEAARYEAERVVTRLLKKLKKFLKGASAILKYGKRSQMIEHCSTSSYKRNLSCI